ncbi:MAG: NUDIX domain-containing protein [Candidatus Omnitrophota bacterium]|nr:NUDIX domain-containing protein [Candidatus Omnitrophota bacterium]
MKKHLDVVAGLITKDGKILLCQRKEHDSFGLLWEFAGGVVEPGEDYRRALIREMKEELDLFVEVDKLVGTFEDENETLKITVRLFSCRVLRGAPLAKDCTNFGFFSYSQACTLQCAPVDRKILAALASEL